MSESKRSSQAQQEAIPINNIKNPFASLAAQFAEQFEAFNLKAADWEKQAVSRAREAAAQSAVMGEQAVTYWTDLLASSRQMAIETTRKVTETISSMRAA